MGNGVVLRILICDQNQGSAQVLKDQLAGTNQVAAVEIADSVPAARDALVDSEYNCIFIDPIELGLVTASEFIFEVRGQRPSLVFVLYLDVARAEADGKQFYHGARARFLHYFTLDKRTPLVSFPTELNALLESCIQYVSVAAPREELKEIRTAARQLNPDDRDIVLRDMDRKLDNLLERIVKSTDDRRRVRRNSVFLSYRFADSEYVDGLKELLTQHGFKVVTGLDAPGYISKAILDRIRDSEFFLCLMTKNKETVDGTFTTSSWLLEEKGAALAFGKYVVLLVEEGVSDFGGLQGDWQRHHFAPKGFITAALKAVGQLQAASGQGGTEA